MPNRQTITQYNSENGRWENAKPHAKRASSTAATKQKAVQLAKKQAIKEKLERVIKNKDGKVAKRNSYGNDPYLPKG